MMLWLLTCYAGCGICAISLLQNWHVLGRLALALGVTILLTMALFQQWHMFKNTPLLLVNSKGAWLINNFKKTPIDIEIQCIFGFLILAVTPLKPGIHSRFIHRGYLLKSWSQGFAKDNAQLHRLWVYANWSNADASQKVL